MKARNTIILVVGFLRQAARSCVFWQAARNTIILVVGFLLLASYVAFVEMKKPKEVEEPKEKAKWVFTLGLDDLTALGITQADKGVYLPKGADGKWYIGGIGGDEADPAKVGSVANRLVDLKSSRAITDTAGDLSAFGLAKPQLTVRLELKGGKEETLLIGDKNPQGYNNYAQKKGSDAIYLIDSTLVEDLAKIVAEPPRKPTPAPSPTGTGTPGQVPTASPGAATPAPSPTIAP
jgi:hypothetical protein